jgi:hypothetical protein
VSTCPLVRRGACCGIENGVDIAEILAHLGCSSDDLSMATRVLGIAAVLLAALTLSGGSQARPLQSGAFTELVIVHSYRGSVDRANFYYCLDDQCVDSCPGQIPGLLVLTMKGHSYPFKADNLCHGSIVSGLSNRFPGKVGVQDYVLAGFYLDPVGTTATPSRRVVAWRMYAQGSVIGTGRFAVTSWYSGGARKIWQGTDDFVNICIDKTQHIRSQGGRLYCYYGGKTNWATIKKLP